MKVDAMSNFQNLVMMQNGSSNQSLTGCMYQLVQSPGPDGKNVLQLIPILNTKDNQVSMVSSPTITNPPVLNVQQQQQPVRYSLPSAVSNANLPYSLNAQLVQQIGSANYIITTQKNPADVSKTIRVDGKLSAHPNNAVILEKPQLNLPPNPQTGTPSYIIMNTKPGSAPMKTIPIFPSGHSLQLPANAEVKSIPASSLPYSIQQRILPPNTNNDPSKIPSVIYVSPVNAMKTPTNIPQSPLLSPVLVPAVQSGTTTPKGPLKWVVQENTESVVPVRTNTETASKIVTFMARAKTEEPNLPSPNATQVKDNSLVMCNNKIYFLSKSTGELKSAVHVKQETPEKNLFDTEKQKDLSKLIEVVLSKNNLPPTTPKPTQNSGSSPLVHPDVASPAKAKTFTPAQASKKEPEVIYIDDDDDEDIPANIQKPQDVHQSKETSSAKVYTPPALQISHNQVKDKDVEIVKVIKDKDVEIVKVTKAPVFRVIDDKTLRAKFGLFKKEKIILKRLPRVRRTSSTSQNKDNLTCNENPERRKLPFSETCSTSKRWKSDDFSMTPDPRSFSTTAPLPAGTTGVTHTMSREGTALTETSAAYRNVSTSHSVQDSAPEMYTEPSDSQSFYVSQDVAGHFSEAPPPPRQRFHFESVYPDETTKDEKIQRLKEVLKEREQALEVLRRQKWP